MDEPVTYHTPDEDYRLPLDTETMQIRIRCACGTFARNIRMIASGVAWLRKAAPPPDLAVQSYRCEDCKEIVIVTARQMRLAS